MPVDVIEQVRRLMEAFDEFVVDVSTDDILQRVGGVSDAEEPADRMPPPPHSADRAGWRRFGLAAAAVVLVAGLVGALVWVNADRSTPSSDTPPDTGATVPTVSLGDFVWPAPPRGYTTLDDLVTAFTSEVLAWDPADTDRAGEFNDQPQPQGLTLGNERLGGSVAVVAIPSPQGWGFVQVDNGGLDASVDDDQTVTLRYTPAAGRPRARSRPGSPRAPPSPRPPRPVGSSFPARCDSASW